MKFNKQINNGTLLIPGGAFKISGFEGGEKVEIHTLDSAVVVLKKQMTTMELIQAMDALHRLATELTVHLARVCGTCDDCEDGCPFDDLEDGMLELPDYDSAEGLLTAMFLLVAEYLPTEDANGNPIEKRHIVSVFKLVQELLAPSRVKGKNQFQLLLEKLPPNHKARWFAGSALNTAEQAMASVISTVLSRLNAFLDSEMEQILCFDTAIDAEKFCNEKSAIFIVLPEEDQTKYFMVSLILQNLYREILTVADENGGRLKNRVVFFADELGTCPPIQSLELMFSASRSRGLMLVPIVQSITGQLQKNYGKEGSEIIVDNCQVNLYGGFAPASQTAVELSKSLGSRTVMSGSISRGKNDPSQSLQMMERPLMTPDELKSMPKGSFIVAKTGVHPMKVKLRLFLDWGIRFGMPYEVPEKAQRFVAYADKQELEESIIRRHYGTIVMDSEQPQGGGTSAGGMAQGIQAAPDSRKTVFRP